MVDKALFEELVARNHPDESGEDAATDDATTTQTTETGAQATDDGGEAAGDATGAAGDAGSDEPAGSTEAVTLTGHDRTIVKAARAAERRAQARVRELEAELAARPAPEAEKPYVPDAVVLEQLEDLDPRAAAMLRQAAEAQGKPAPASAPAEPEFVPEAFEDESIQDAIDSVPDLLAWQTDATKQGEWRRAKAMDKFLSLDPVWSQKPLEDRLAETVRRCKADGAAPTPSKPTAADAQRVIAAKAKETPLSVGDLRGRTPQTQRPSKRAAWATMSKEAILNTLEE